MTVIRFDSVTCDYEGRRALGPVTVELSERRIGIIGPNGGGKSTFVRLINGLADASTGRVDVGGLDPARKGRDVRRNVGFVFSDADNQIVMPTVAEDVSFSLRQRGIAPKDREELALSALRRFDLADHADHSPHLLSGGQKQLLALTSVLVLEPELVIADEPTTALDVTVQKQVIDLLNDLREKLGFAMVFVSHDLALVAKVAHSITVMYAGQVVEQGDHQSLLAEDGVYARLYGN